MSQPEVCEEIELLGVADLSRLFHRDRQTIFRWMRERGLPYVRVLGGRPAIRFRESRVRAWARRNQLDASF